MAVGLLSSSCTPGSGGRYPPLSPETFGGARLEVRAPFSVTSITVEPGGRVLYASTPTRGQGVAPETGERDITGAEFSRFFAVLDEAQFFQLSDRYAPDPTVQVHDVSTRVISVTVGKKTKTVISELREGPPEFEAVEDAMKTLWGGEFRTIGV